MNNQQQKEISEIINEIEKDNYQFMLMIAHFRRYIMDMNRENDILKLKNKLLMISNNNMQKDFNKIVDCKTFNEIK